MRKLILALLASVSFASVAEAQPVNPGSGLTIANGDLRYCKLAGCTLTGVFAATSGAFGGATIGSNTLAVTGTSSLAGNVSLGPDVASPAARTVSVPSVVAGTSNTAGVLTTIVDSAGTGTGATGGWNFLTHPAGGSGTTQNATFLSLNINTDIQGFVGAAGVIDWTAGTTRMRISGNGTVAVTGSSAGLTIVKDFLTSNGTIQYLGSAGGTADALTTTTSPAISGYNTGATYYVLATATNITTTPTINMSALGVKTIVKRASTALAAGDILSGAMLLLAYNGTNIVLLNPVVP